MAIEYRELRGFPAYRVGSDGSVWSRTSTGCRPRLVSEWKPLKPVPRAGGYVYVTLSKGSERRQVAVHQLVLESFVGPCPCGMQACHYPDRIVTNNALTNLRWDTRVNNMRDKIEHGTLLVGVRHPNRKLDAQRVLEILRRHAAGESMAQLARVFAVSKGTVQDIWEGRTWKHLPRDAKR